MEGSGMRTIYREIVGGYIFSRDGKLLLGKNRKGGAYEGLWVIPGGGIEEGETKKEALRRELLEETGIDIDKAKITPLGPSSGAHEKTLRDTGERVLVEMDFFNYRVDLSGKAGEVTVRAEDDWGDPRWFEVGELESMSLGAPTRATLVAMGMLSERQDQGAA
jgi:8-oxo-dGTP pyrophosphatase MutT (NUDIX family)